MFEISDLRREILHRRSVCFSPGPGTLILYFHTYVGSGYIFWLKILNFNIFWVFQKTEYFWGYEDFCGVITKLNDTMHFRVFSEGQGTGWRIFFGLLKFKYLFGVLEILDIF